MTPPYFVGCALIVYFFTAGLFVGVRNPLPAPQSQGPGGALVARCRGGMGERQRVRQTSCRYNATSRLGLPVHGDESWFGPPARPP